MIGDGFIGVKHRHEAALSVHAAGASTATGVTTAGKGLQRATKTAGGQEASTWHLKHLGNAARAAECRHDRFEHQLFHDHCARVLQDRHSELTELDRPGCGQLAQRIAQPADGVSGQLPNGIAHVADAVDIGLDALLKAGADAVAAAEFLHVAERFLEGLGTLAFGVNGQAGPLLLGFELIFCELLELFLICNLGGPNGLLLAGDQRPALLIAKGSPQQIGVFAHPPCPLLVILGAQLAEGRGRLCHP